MGGLQTAQCEEYNITQLNENIQATEDEILKLRNKLEQFKRHHL